MHLLNKQNIEFYKLTLLAGISLNVGLICYIYLLAYNTDGKILLHLNQFGEYGVELAFVLIMFIGCLSLTLSQGNKIIKSIKIFNNKNYVK